MLKNRSMLLSNILLFSIMILCPESLTAQEIPQASSVQHNSFVRWGLSFEYPQGWQEYSSDRVQMMKDYIEEQLRSENITLLEFTMITAPQEEASLMISKYTRPSAFTAEDILKERKTVYRDAQAAGDVTEINQLEITMVDNKPALIEDVEISNGGRGRTIKVIDGQVIFEISLIVSDKNKFSDFQSEFEHLLETLMAGSH